MNISPEKLVVIGILALLVLGPNRLPEVARSAGKVLADLRRMSGSLQSELKGALTEPQQALAHAVDEFGIKDLRSLRGMTSVGGMAAAVLTSSPTAPTASDAPGEGDRAPSDATDPQAAPAPYRARVTAGQPPMPAGPSPATAGLPPVPDDPSFN